jgi:hypothetical protein
LKIDRALLDRLGQAIVDQIVIEAKKDFAKQGKRGRRGEPQGLPNSEGKKIKPSFFESFFYQIRGQRTIEIFSTWPWIEGLIEGRPPAPMESLVGDTPHPVPFLKEDGTVIFRMTPISLRDAWIHPGIAKHTFLERGVQNAREEMAVILAEELAERLSK